ncbi:MAG: hypothetical protein K9H49_19180 [Bacteroidales bacterium]|nr:hypothetical protein [Bacteroidales bacterium]MCF8391754.1 hypothetical protein [Bacteroidales bacterium]
MKTKKHFLSLAILFCAGIVSSFAADVFMSTLSDLNGNQVATAVTLDAANTYILDGRYYVTEGQTLTIPAGTKIKATYGTGLAAPALIITRGAQLFANGTAAQPVIFTTIEDQLDGNYPIKNQGRWGGIIMLGRAYNNLMPSLGTQALAIQDGEGTIEGLDVPDPRHHYGQDRWEPGEEAVAGFTAVGDLKIGGDFNDADNSGSLTYVSIRHGGAVIGAANEINGLTLGSVGSGTILDHIEVVSNMDDGIEFFGGTANIKYATVLFCNDDYLDWDQGYTGSVQFMYGLQLPASTNPVYSREGDNGFEMDGDDDKIYTGALPAGVHLSNPTIYNATLIGNANDEGMEAKERTEGTIRNSIFANFKNGVNLNNSSAHTIDGYQNWLNGTLVIENNIFAGNTNMLAVAGVAASATDVTAFEGDGNSVDNSIIDYTLVINGITNSVSNSVDPVPAAGTAAATSVAAGAFFETAAFAGAFEPGAASSWIDTWTVQDVLTAQCPSDLNNNGVTDSEDFLLFLPQFGVNCGE